jgi:DNA-binding NtrC family response regulator/predicted ATPase
MAHSSRAFTDPAERMVGNAPVITALRQQIHHLATFDAVGSPHVPTVLLQGETGTGKGLVARVLHDAGPRARGPFIDVNCAAIPETLLEAELYGFEAGAFTDAKRANPGLFETASGGTLFLDEIDALPLPLQAKLLRSIEDKRVRRLGAVDDRSVDAKVVAAAQTPLARQVSAGRFRADLYHRLAVVVLEIPPLRERGDDVLLLAQHFLRRYADAHGLAPKRLHPSAQTWLRGYDWPGNLRELSQLMERATFLSPEAIIGAETLDRLRLPGPSPAVPVEPGAASSAGPPPADEPSRIRSALVQAAGNVLRAARLMGMSRNALRYRMLRYGIVREARDSSPAAPPEDRTTSRSAPLPASAAIWEKKPVAVLAVDLTFPAAGADVAAFEPWTLATRWQRMLAERIEGFGGVLLERAPSVYTAVFGVPRALEHMPRRAAQAALAIRHLVEEAGGPEPSPEARLSVHLGEVLADQRAGSPDGQMLGLGDTLTLPVRLLGLAAPGEIMASSTAGRALGRSFILEPRASAAARDEVAAYAVIGLKPEPLAPAMSGSQPFARFVGRTRELAELRRGLGLAKQGRGQIVAVVGEAGVGKSRLCYEFKQDAGHESLGIEISCVSHGKSHSLLPLIELLERYCELSPRDDQQIRREKVTGKVLAADPGLADSLPYLLALLGLPDPTSSLAQIDPPIRRQRTFEALKRLLLQESVNQPVLLVVEDLHWLDDDTQGFLDLLGESVPTARLLLLVNYRPEYRHSWLGKSYYAQIRLDPLAADEAQELLAGLVAERGELTQLILDKTQGNPFFIEELVQALLEQGVLVRDTGSAAMCRLAADSRPVNEVELPPTLQGVLAARIDRLPSDERALLQIVAVLGNEFPLGLARMVVNRPDEEVQRLLGRLRSSEFIYEQPAAPETAYIFKHPLTQDVAYASLPLAERRALHARAAGAIETLFSERLDDHLSALAHHYLRAEMTEQAVEYLGRAGQQSVERSAYAEAVGHLNRAIGLLGTFPETPERRQQELGLQIALGPALMAIKGLGAPEVEQVFTRARELCAEAGETPELFKVLQGLSVFHALRVKLRAAEELVEQRRRLAERLPHPAFLPQAHIARGHVLLALGDVTGARAALDRGMALYNPRQHHTLAFGTGLDPSGRDHAAIVLWLLGYPEQALASLRQAVGLARERSHPFSLAVAHNFAAMLHQLRREPALAREPAEAAMTLSAEHGFAMFHAFGMIFGGWALVGQGRVADGLTLMQEGIAAHRATGAELLRPYLLSLLAEAHGRAGQPSEGFAALAEALAAAEKSEERWWEAELHRLRGMFLVAGAAETDKAPPVEAEACFQTALEIARRQGARSVELRAAVSLGRSWQRRGNSEEARSLLAEVHGWFTEGFDTPDLQEASALLDSLSAPKT